MVTVKGEIVVVDKTTNKAILPLVGLSTDTKPTGTFEQYTIANGSTFLEMDTPATSYYDESTDAWV